MFCSTLSAEELAVYDRRLVLEPNTKGRIIDDPLDPCPDRATASRFPGLSEWGAEWIAVNDRTVPVVLYLNGIEGPDLGPGSPILLNDLLDLKNSVQDSLVLKAYGYDAHSSNSAGIGALVSGSVTGVVI